MKISRSDLLSLEDFSQKRDLLRKEVIALKKDRRVPVGPDATFYFENKQTLLWQIQEMLYIEKGGESQIEDEIAAYGPLVPNGRELICTLMIEIEDPLRRRVLLNELGGIEETIFLKIGETLIQAEPADDLDRTDAFGKTSAVHFLRFSLPSALISDFKTGAPSTLSIQHPRYHDEVTFSKNTQNSLSNDLV